MPTHRDANQLDDCDVRGIRDAKATLDRTGPEIVEALQRRLTEIQSRKDGAHDEELVAVLAGVLDLCAKILAAGHHSELRSPPSTVAPDVKERLDGFEREVSRSISFIKSHGNLLLGIAAVFATAGAILAGVFSYIGLDRIETARKDVDAEVTKSTERLNATIGEVKAAAESQSRIAKDALADATDELHSDVARDIEKSKEDLGSAIDRAGKKAQDEVAKSQADLEHTISGVNQSVRSQARTAASIHEAMAELGLGQQELTHDRNPENAQRRARRAIELLDAETARLRNEVRAVDNTQVADASPNDGTVLVSNVVDAPNRQGQPANVEQTRPIRRAAWILLARAALELADFDDLERWGQTLIDDDGSSTEGYHFRGIARLGRATGESTDRDERDQHRNRAIEDLRASTRENARGSTDYLLLAGASAEGGRFRDCFEYAQKFVESYQSGAARGYPHRSRMAHEVLIGQCWMHLAAIRLQNATPDPRLQQKFCAVASRDAIPRSEGLILAELFDDVGRNAKALGFRDPSQVKWIEWFTGAIAGAIRSSSCSSPTNVPGGGSPSTCEGCAPLVPVAETGTREVILNCAAETPRTVYVNARKFVVGPYSQVRIPVPHVEYVTVQVEGHPQEKRGGWKRRADGTGDEIELIIR